MLLNQNKMKLPDVIKRVRAAVAAGRYIYSSHCIQRQDQRGIADGDLRCAIANGWHEKRKDEWNEEFSAWNYTIRGNSLDAERLRIAVAFEEVDENEIIVVTVINLDRQV